MRTTKLVKRKLALPLPLLLTLALAPVAAADAPGRAPAADFDEAALRKAGVEPRALRCNHDNRWGATLRPDAEEGAAELMRLFAPSLTPAAQAPGEARQALQKKAQNILFWRMVRSVLIEGNNNNLGAFPLRGRFYTDAAGRRRQVLVFRSGLTPAPGAPGSCFQSLLAAGHVRHVVNLFDGEIPAADLVAAESAAAQGGGATYHTASDDPSGYGPWRDLLRKSYDDPALRQRATDGVARLIREQILNPGSDEAQGKAGAAPKGNVHLHCGGGMHRSGMVAGLLERCINRAPLATVEAHYLYHVGYRDAEHPGGMEEGNLRFIREFDCRLLESPAKAE